MIKKTIGASVLAGLLVLAQAPSASAAVHAWTSPPDTSTLPCHYNIVEDLQVESCLIARTQAGVPGFQAVMVLENMGTTGIQLHSAVINMWALPSPSKQIRGDSCPDTGLSSGYGAACYGTFASRAQVCAAKPDARSVTANAAINAPSESTNRIAVTSTALAISC
ncbi:hypothetical protein [Kutzneria kofuensis]|uniref:Secreted protein n=1 Tax=Kutzneria kofuensis TaxID=103725 RepID=A0A7W9KAC6_9PSEU|nr:hypothetical protein [Kutzneria kofuensis]MBB5888944.1 hypothetical protein [Kutzneria kofuensis]